MKRRIPIICFLGSVALPAVCWAQNTQNLPESPTENSGRRTDLEEIVVTAQKRSQSLQDTAIAVTAVTAETIQRQQIKDISNLNGVAPGLVIGGSSGLGGNNSFSMRGVTAQVAPIGGSPSAVGVYLDGVYLSRPDAAFFGLADVERIEVLRGPQGTLYGRNTAGGAINIITLSPSNVLKGSADISYGNHDAVDAKGYISGPLAHGFSASLSGSYQRRDGYFTNTVTGNNIGRSENYTGRTKLRYDNDAGTFNLQLTYDRTRRENQEVFYNLVNFPGVTTRDLSHPTEVATLIEPYIGTNQTAQGVSLVAEGDLGNGFTLTEILSWRDFKSHSIYDGALSTRVLQSYADVKSQTLSSETRLFYSSTRVKLTLGLNYYHEKGYHLVGAATRLAASGPPPFTFLAEDRTQVEQFGLFGQLEYSVTRQLEIVLGGRFQRELRRFAQISFPPNNPVVQASTPDGVFIPKAGINFRPWNDTLLYASVTKGYQSPGYNFNGNPFASTTAPLRPFAGENLWAYEAGAKVDLFDRRLRLGAAAFRYDYKNLQVRQTIVAPGNPIPQSSTSNAASARVTGVEIEAAAAITEGFTVKGSLSYLDAKFLSYCETGGVLGGDMPCTIGALAGGDRSGNRLLQAPKWQWSAGAQYTRQVTEALALHINADYIHSGRVFFSAANIPAFGNGGYDRIDGRLGLELHEKYEFYVYGRNLTNERHATGGVFFFPNIVPGSLNDPRQYGVGVRLKL